MKGDKPFVGTSMELDTHFVVYIPSTSGNYKKRIDEAIGFFTKLFGGTTEFSAVGTYVSQKTGMVIREKVALVDVYTTRDNWDKKKDMIKGWLKSKKKAWKQEELAIQFEEDMYWV
jgi:hypothetical protein